MRFLVGLPLILAASACGGDSKSGTYILVDIDRHNIVGDVIYSFDTTLTIDNHAPVMHTFPETANGPITKDHPTFTFELDESVTGVAHLLVNARDKQNAFLSSGNGMATIETDGTADLKVTLDAPSADHVLINPSRIEVAAGIGLAQTLTFTIMNPTTLATQAPLTMTGLAAPPFTVPSQICGGSPIAAGGMCMVQPSFDPGTQTDDAHSYAVQVSSPRASLASAVVVARKLNAPLVMDHAEFDDFTSAMPSKVVTITNPSTTAGVMMTTTVTGSGFTASGCPSTVVAQGTCPLTVTFTGSGTTTATLTIATQTPVTTTTDITLKGN